MVKKYFRYAKRFLPIFGIFLFIYTVWSLDINEIIDAFLRVPIIYVVIALPLTLPRVLVRNVAWKMIQKEHNIDVSYWTSLKIFLIGYFYGSITPGYMGQLMRIPYMKEETGEPYGKLFVNSFLETILHTFSLYIMIIIGAILVITVIPELIYYGILWIIAFILVLSFFIKKQRGEKIFHFLIKYLIPSKIKSQFYQFVDTFYDDLPKVKKLIPPIIVGSITWVIIFSQEYLIVHALDLPIPYHYFLLLFPIANAIGFIPVTFAGLGTREAAAIFLFSPFVPEDRRAEIFVVSFLGFIITDIFTGLVGLVVALNESRKSPLKKLSFIQ